MAKGGMGNIMKQAQMMQANLQKAQAELANIDVEGSAGNGMIKITISCKHEIKKIDIDPSLLEDKEMLEDLIMVAFKDALGKVESTSSQKNGRLSSSGNEFAFFSLMQTNNTLENLIDSLKCLPGVGPKSALRLAYYLLQRDRKGAHKLAMLN